jgi:hypothetical protein
MLTTPEEDDIFHQLAGEFFWNGPSLGIARFAWKYVVTETQTDKPQADITNNLLSILVFEYLRKKNRFEKVIQFYQQYILLHF